MAPENPTPTAVLCPHCRQPLSRVAWLINAEAGLVTLYHDEPTCMVALNCQMVVAERPRIELPHSSRFS